MPHLGPRVLVTGAGGALGAVVVPTLLARGVDVVAVDLAWSNPPDGATALTSDLADDDAVQGVLDRAGRLDGIAHLAGGFASGPRLHETTPGDWQRMLDLNLGLTVRLLRPAVQRMLEASPDPEAGESRPGWGSIVVVSASSALPGREPAFGAAPYVVSKAAVASLVRVAAAECAHSNVRINAIAPTILDTPANRAAMPEADVSTWVPRQRAADTIAFLLSDAAMRISGQIIRLA